MSPYVLDPLIDSFVREKKDVRIQFPGTGKVDAPIQGILQ
jgi:hypothetical protein